MEKNLVQEIGDLRAENTRIRTKNADLDTDLEHTKLLLRTEREDQSLEIKKWKQRVNDVNIEALESMDQWKKNHNLLVAEIRGESEQMGKKYSQIRSQLLNSQKNSAALKKRIADLEDMVEEGKDELMKLVGEVSALPELHAKDLLNEQIVASTKLEHYVNEECFDAIIEKGLFEKELTEIQSLQDMVRDLHNMHSKSKDETGFAMQLNKPDIQGDILMQRELRDANRDMLIFLKEMKPAYLTDSLIDPFNDPSLNNNNNSTGSAYNVSAPQAARRQSSNNPPMPADYRSNSIPNEARRQSYNDPYNDPGGGAPFGLS